MEAADLLNREYTQQVLAIRRGQQASLGTLLGARLQAPLAGDAAARFLGAFNTAAVGTHWPDLEPQLAVDYEMANHFTSTYPGSHFVQSLTAQRARRQRRAILRNRELVVREGAASSSSIIRDPDHLLEILAREFDLAFPPGTRFSKPDFS